MVVTAHSLEQLIGCVMLLCFGMWRLVVLAGRRNRRSFDRHVNAALRVAGARPSLRVVRGGD